MAGALARRGLLRVGAPATLLADAGASAVEADFFRSPEFLEAEGTTHTLLVEGDGARSAIPVVVREIPDSGGAIDAISPYSYPGAKVSGDLISPAEVDFGETGLVSVFIRDRLGSPAALIGGNERSVVLLHDPELPRKSRMSDRQQVRKNEAAGYAVERVPGPRSTPDQRAAFLDVYLQTMESVAAAGRYLFDAAYFDLLLSSDLTQLFSVLGPDGEVLASALVVESDGFIHYYLSGTSNEHRRRAPSKNLIFAVCDHADERGTPMNLGGGVRPSDGLEGFKRGFANRELPFRTHELICDPERYVELSAGKDPDAGFFPLYRS